MKTLVIAPHMDDETLSCGGTIVRHVEAGHHVTVCIVANRAYGHKYKPELINHEKASCQKAQEILAYQDLIFLDLPDEQLDRAQIDIIIPLERKVQTLRGFALSMMKRRPPLLSPVVGRCSTVLDVKPVAMLLVLCKDWRGNLL